MPAVHIAFAKAHQIEAVAELYHDVWHETQAPLVPYSEIGQRNLQFFTDRIASILHRTQIASIGSEIAGFAACKENSLWQLFIRQDYRRTGIGLRLLRAAETDLAKHGTVKAELYCLMGNEGARSFYEHFGWRVCAIDSRRNKKMPEAECIRFWHMIKRL